MANLKVLRQRIHSIKATKKITSAMKLIATSHFKKLQKTYQASADYSHGIYECLKAVLDHRELEHDLPPLLQPRPKSKELRLILGSDKGLCGGFNPAIVKYAVSQDYHDNMFFLLIGEKLSNLIPSKFKEKVVNAFSMHGKTTYKESLRLAYLLEHKILSNQFDNISVAYNRFRSVLCYTPTVHTFTPFNGPLEGKEPSFVTSPALFDVEPNVPTLLKALAIKNLTAQILHTCIESHMSEESARMMAMDTSTRSAEDMLDALETKYHRSRQSMITNELIEIIAGAESL